MTWFVFALTETLVILGETGSDWLIANFESPQAFGVPRIGSRRTKWSVLFFSRGMRTPTLSMGRPEKG